MAKIVTYTAAREAYTVKVHSFSIYLAIMLLHIVVGVQAPSGVDYCLPLEIICLIDTWSLRSLISNISVILGDCSPQSPSVVVLKEGGGAVVW